MKVPRENIEVTWHAVSKTRFKFLCLRRAQLIKNYQNFSDQVAINECCSDFEIGGMWSIHHRPGGSFLLIGCHARSISISSYILGVSELLPIFALMILRIYPTYGYNMQNTRHGCEDSTRMFIFMGNKPMK